MSKLIDLNNVATLNILTTNGFQLWEDEDWKPEGQVVDWSNDYDQALAQFAEAMVHATLLVIDMDVGALSAEEHAAVLLGVQQRFGKVDSYALSDN